MKRHLSRLLAATMLAPCFATAARGSSDQFDLMCRDRAKEIAAQTYKTCIIENKSAKIDEIKKKFQQRLKAMKAEYAAEMQKLGAKTKASPKSKLTDEAPISQPEENSIGETESNIPEPIEVEQL